MSFRQRSVTYVKSFLRAFTREKRYPMCFKFRFVSSPPLRGENTYRLHVPANVPVSQFWSVTVYNGETAALFLNLPRPSLDSLDQGMRRNADGSVDIYFGPKAPAGQESNWIYTPAEKSWFPWFRFHGPEKPLFDKSWKMPDIEMVKQQRF